MIPKSDPLHARCSSGFTLVEIMIVVVIIGILIAIAIPGFKNVKEASLSARLAKDYQVFAEAINRYDLANGQFPAPNNIGEIPTDLRGSINESAWIETGVGGSWMLLHNSFGTVATVALIGSNMGDIQMTQVDFILDDGDLGNGNFRKFGTGRYALILR